MKSLFILTFLIIIVSLKSNAGLPTDVFEGSCRSIEIPLSGEEQRLLRFQSCHGGDTLSQFSILSAELGQYQCSQVDPEGASQKGNIEILCQYLKCEKRRGFLATQKCHSEEADDLLIFLEGHSLSDHWQANLVY